MAKSFSIAALMRNVDNRFCKLLQSYSDVANYLLQKFATDQAIAEFDSAILLYIHPANITLQQYPDDLVTKSWTVANVLDEGPMNDIFTERVDSLSRYSLTQY